MALATSLLLSCLLLNAVNGLAGPPAARPPDFETLQRSFSEDQQAVEVMKRVIITKATTEPTTEKATIKEEESEFADKMFSAENTEETTEGVTTTESPTTTKTEEITTEQNKSVEASTETNTPSTTESTTTDTSTQATTEKAITKEEEPLSTPALKRVEIKKIVRSTTPLPPPEDRLSPIEELRLLKKLANQGIAFGVKNKELELIHTADSELELPPFAFSEDENSVTEGSLERVLPTTEESTRVEPILKTKPTTTESTTKSTTESTTEVTTESTTKSTTIQSTTTTTTQATITTAPKKSPSFTASSPTADIEVLEKELVRYKEEPFRVGTNIVPLHLFFDRSMGVHKRRKLAKAKELDALKEAATTKGPQTSSTTRIPALMQPFITSTKPRTDDFLVPRPEDNSKADDEKKLDSFSFPSSVVSNDRPSQQPSKKSKRPEKMILPSLLEMPQLSTLNTFKSLSIPIHPKGLSQKINTLRLDSDPDVTVSAKNRTSGSMVPKRKRRVLRKKHIPVTPSKNIESETVQENKSPSPVRIVLKKVVTPTESTPLPTPNPQTNTLPTIAGSAKIIRTNDAAGQEQIFAASLTKKGSTTIQLVLDSLKKMKKATRLILKKNKRSKKAKANSAGKTVQVARLHSHDGNTDHIMKVDGNTDSKTVVVVDRDPSRKTVDRDA